MRTSFVLLLSLLLSAPALASEERPATPTEDGAPEVGGDEERGEAPPDQRQAVAPEAPEPPEVGGHEEAEPPEVGGHEEAGRAPVENEGVESEGAEVEELEGAEEAEHEGAEGAEHEGAEGAEHEGAEHEGAEHESANSTPATDEVGGHEERGDHAAVVPPKPVVKRDPGDVGFPMLLVLLAVGGGLGINQAVRKQLG